MDGLWRIEIRKADGSEFQTYLQGGESRDDAAFHALRHYADNHGIDTKEKLLELKVSAVELRIQDALQAQQQANDTRACN